MPFSLSKIVTAERKNWLSGMAAGQARTAGDCLGLPGRSWIRKGRLPQRRNLTLAPSLN